MTRLELTTVLFGRMSGLKLDSKTFSLSLSCILHIFLSFPATFLSFFSFSSFVSSLSLYLSIYLSIAVSIFLSLLVPFNTFLSSSLNYLSLSHNFNLFIFVCIFLSFFFFDSVSEFLFISFHPLFLSFLSLLPLCLSFSLSLMIRIRKQPSSCVSDPFGCPFVPFECLLFHACCLMTNTYNMIDVSSNPVFFSCKTRLSGPVVLPNNVLVEWLMKNLYVTQTEK